MKKRMIEREIGIIRERKKERIKKEHMIRNEEKK